MSKYGIGASLVVAASVAVGVSAGAVAGAAPVARQAKVPSVRCSGQRATKLVAQGGTVKLGKRSAVVVVTGKAAKVEGGAGHDWICGGKGNDRLYGGAGNDHIYGGPGNDRIDGGAGNDYLYGGAGKDVISVGAGNDHADGGAGNDTIYGGPGVDVLDGGSGNDTLIAWRGGAVVDVRADGSRAVTAAHGGMQILNGGPGNDTLECGSGNCLVNGGGGTDRAVLGSGPATVTAVATVVLGSGSLVLETKATVVVTAGPHGSITVPAGTIFVDVHGKPVATPPGVVFTGGSATPSSSPSPAPTVKFGDVLGVVRNAQGVPLPGILLYACTEEQLNALDCPSSAVTDTHGNYDLENVPTGDLDIVVNPKLYLGNDEEDTASPYYVSSLPTIGGTGNNFTIVAPGTNHFDWTL